MIPFKVLFPRQDQDDRVAHPTAGCCAGGSACAPEDVSLLSLVVNSEPAKEKRGGGGKQMRVRLGGMRVRESREKTNGRCSDRALPRESALGMLSSVAVRE